MMGRRLRSEEYPLEACRYCGKVPKLHKEIILIPTYSFQFRKDINTPTYKYSVRCKCGIQTKQYKTPTGAQRTWNRCKKGSDNP